MVDDEDWENVRQHSWRVMRNRRDGRSEKTYAVDGDGVLLHRFLLQPPDHVFVDHIDGNGLNCQRGNLRLATRSENACNRGKQRNTTSGYRDVSWRNDRGKWLAFVKLHQRMHNLGLYDTAEEAAAVVSEARQRLHGAFASD